MPNRSLRGPCLVLALALALVAPGTWAQDPPAQPPEAQKPRPPELSPEQKIAEALEQKKMSVNFTDAPLADVFAFFQEFTGLNLAFDSSLATAKTPIVLADLKVTMKVADLPAGNVLALLLKMHGLDSKVMWGTILVSTPERLKTLAPTAWCAAEKGAPEWKAALAQTLIKTRVNLDFTDALVMDILEFLREFAQVNLVVVGKAPDGPKVTLQLKDLPIRDVVNLVAWMYGLDVELDNMVVQLKPRPPQPPQEK